MYVVAEIAMRGGRSDAAGWVRDMRRNKMIPCGLRARASDSYRNWTASIFARVPYAYLRIPMPRLSGDVLGARIDFATRSRGRGVPAVPFARRGAPDERVLREDAAQVVMTVDPRSEERRV